MQPAGGGALRSGRGDPLPRSLCQLDPAALLMLLVDADQPEPVRSGARELALFLTPEPRAEVGDWGWRSGRWVFGLRVRSPRAWAGRVDGCGPPTVRDPDTNPPLPCSILSHRAQGLRAWSGRPEGSGPLRSGDCLAPPRDPRQVAHLFQPTASGDSDSAPTPSRDSSASAGTPDPGALGAAALGQAGLLGRPTTTGPLRRPAASLLPDAPGRVGGGAGRLRRCGDVARRENT